MPSELLGPLMPVMVNEKNGIRIQQLVKPGQACVNRLLRRLRMTTKKSAKLLLKGALSKEQEIYKGEG